MNRWGRRRCVVDHDHLVLREAELRCVRAQDHLPAAATSGLVTSRLPPLMAWVLMRCQDYLRSGGWLKKRDGTTPGHPWGGG